MSVLLVIPARHASTRYPGKPLAPLRGATGESRSLLRRSWDAAREVRGIDRVVVATEDERIRAHAMSFGAEVVMTSDRPRNGTERCVEAMDLLGDHDLVVNLQGDAPLTPPWFVEDLVAGLDAAPSMQVATPVLRMEGAALTGFLEDRREGRVGGTTAVFGTDRRALYFSKEVVPYTGRPYAPREPTPVFHHVGVYAYRPGALRAYAAREPGPLETLEGLEQLRFLEHGIPVLCVEVEARGREFWELNNPSDVPRIEAMMATMGMP
ncbi:3-deoxy-manno-octulosonate cytidylyltransferase [Rubellimicrobium mesophilum DSM 19309]|uniref:3-deoxy-manno-octulosonate cytidylyltransferase n=1 Tax=Rubellimicrobium mesophilum DSM 19309 TaxID=442562 RepID=A0A017HRF1_9RHOB|nr:manno-octulosonate cytidylyltransferase [Rubellimicrobium mesophilum]EYD76349.1 3-deoxy-manno-octulosonate cytidylyltransferase [Rubellimicrobium mesophilum DSM 19309]